MVSLSNRTTGSRLFDVVNVTFMLAVVFVTLYPMYYIAIISVSDGNEVLQGNVWIWPKGTNLETYRFVLKDPSIVRSMLNTLFYTSLGTFINILFTAMCAYPLSRRRFFARKFVNIVVIITMFFQGGLIPLYLVVMKLGLINTVWAIVLVPAINAWYMFIMRTFFQGIPEELHESALMDGANDLVILIRIILPLARPVIATLLLFYAVFHWNRYLQPMIFLNEKSKYPIQLILRSIVVAGRMEQTNQIGAATDYMVIEKSIKYAVIMISTLPILMVYPFLQKYFVKGVMVGALKG